MQSVPREFERLVTVRGVFSDADGTPIADASMRIAGAPGWQRSNEKGEFEFENVLPGNYRTQIHADGYHQGTSNISISYDILQIHNIELQSLYPHSAEGYVYLGEEHQPDAAVTFRFRSRGRNGRRVELHGPQFSAVSAKTDKNGYFIRDGLPDREVEMSTTLELDGTRRKKKEIIDLTSDATAHHDVVFKNSDCSLRVTADLGEDHPEQRLSVWLATDSNETIYVLDDRLEQRVRSFENLPEGNISIFVMTEEVATKTEQIRFTAGAHTDHKISFDAGGNLVAAFDGWHDDDLMFTAVLLYGTHDVPQFQTDNALFKFLTPIMAGSGTAERGRINFVGVKAAGHTLVAFKKTWDDQRSFIAERRSYEIEVFDDETLKADFEF